MIKVLGVLLTIALVAGSIAGTAASGWILGEALHPARAGFIVGPFTLGLVLAAVAVTVEMVRLAVSVYGERLWRRSRFRGVAFAVPLWLACTAYCILMPLLALALVPLLPTRFHMLTVIAPAWAALQIAAGLLPGIGWFAREPVPATHTDQVGVQGRPETTSPMPLASMPDIKERVPVAEMPAALTAQAAAPDLAIPATASANDFLRLLSRLSELPAGSTLPRRGRIGTNHEIMISQAGLAALVGRSKPTVRRWLQELERDSHIIKRPRGKDTCILLTEYATAINGGSHLNGASKGAAPAESHH